MHGLGIGVPRRNRRATASVQYYEEYLLANYAANLKGFFSLAYDDKDGSSNANHAFTRSGARFTGPTPVGFRNRQATLFDGAASQIRLEDTTYPFGLARWTIMCWFKKTGAGATTSTSGGADGFPSTDPVVPLVTKGRGEAEGSNVDCNWFFGLNKVTNGATYKLAGDFETNPGGGNNRIVGATALNDNQWYHGVFTFDGTALKLYLNGALESTVNTSNAPRSDSIQKAGIGTAYTSAAAAAGFFAGYLAAVSIWSEALTLIQIQDLYNKGVSALRTERTITYDAPDNQIVHGANFANWSVDGLGSSKGAGGITLRSDSGNYAEITVSGLSPGTYWARIDIAAKSAGASGELQVAALDDRSATVTGLDYDVISLGNTLVGTEPKYFQVLADSLPAKLVIHHVGSPAGETIQFSDFRIFAAPARSTAKVVVLGDRTGNFVLANAQAVDDAILSANADALNVVFNGDGADTTNDYATCNDRLKLGPAGNNGILSRGGKIYPCNGNHDWDGTRENDFPGYYDIANYNGGKFYYPMVLGECEFFFYNDNVEEADNAGIGYNTATPSQYQTNVQGQYLIKRLNDSTARWKIFCFHHPAWSSSASGSGWGHSRWDWFGLFVPLVLQAHLHGVERLEEQTTVEGGTRKTTYYTCAMGGGSHFGWAAKLNGATAFTRYRLEDQTMHGYLKVYDSPTDLVLEYYDTNNALRDRIRFQQS